MFLWISFALLAAAVATALLREQVGPHDPNADPDLAVYRDQLAEIEADARRGVIAADQAVAARAELGRRIIAHATPSDAGNAAAGAVKTKRSTPRMSSDRLLLASGIAIPVLSLALYLSVGSPSLPGRPLAGRLAEAPDKARPDDMIAKVEARLREKPDDGMGWSVIAPVYLSQGRALEAADAYARAIKLVGETPDRLAGLAKAHVLAGNGIVNDPARKAYERLLALDPDRVEATFWLAVADEQNGRPEIAAATYRAILDKAPKDAPYRSAIEERLAAVTQNKGPPQPNAPVSAPTPSAPFKPAPPVLAQGDTPAAGPTPTEFVAAAQKLAPEMREAMIGGKMIPKARDAVTSNPKDFAAWSRIVTGQMALGKPTDARATLKEARGALSGEAKALADLDKLAADFGLSL